MTKSLQFFLLTVGVLSAVSSVMYLGVRLNTERAISSQVNTMLDDTIKEKEQLQTYSSQIEEQLKEKERRLAQLSDVQAIHQTVESNQEMLNRLNVELDKSNRERIALQDANLSLKSRVDSTTKELMRTLDELKKAKADLAQLNAGGMAAFKKKADDATAALAAREEELAQLKTSLESLRKEKSLLDQNSKTMEKQLSQLQGQVSGKRLPPEQAAQSEASLKEFQGSARDLKQALAAKEQQIAGLELEVERLQALQKQRSPKESGEFEKLYQTARDQANKLTELLVRKENDIDQARRDLLDSREKLVGLQNKVGSLERDAAAGKASETKLRELQQQNLSLQNQVNELRVSLDKKTDVADSLQKNLDYVSKQLAQSQEQVKVSETQLARVQSTITQELEKERGRSQETGILYSSLKTQVAQFSDALNQKEMELDQKRREVNSLQDQIGSLRSRSDSIERDLQEMKERQKKTLDDLVSAVKLNTILQERLMNAPLGGKAADMSTEQQKADDLRRRVKVILESDQRNNP